MSSGVCQKRRNTIPFSVYASYPPDSPLLLSPKCQMARRHPQTRTTEFLDCECCILSQGYHITRTVTQLICIQNGRRWRLLCIDDTTCHQRQRLLLLLNWRFGSSVLMLLWLTMMGNQCA